MALVARQASPTLSFPRRRESSPWKSRRDDTKCWG